ncbi:hypothetical protein BCV72DRAFT_203902 [Rhizopus microsporus var. microsporus]|uniref:G-protein coupled receptors family 3 profile domain-containing protein n=1 Tax=Rhizopus microsporus var. microsporus TaxID=86635 RepID=A0A1X0R8C6_RHIZD|nr:hypothetical protein BCV72DRAFT_203902 [Rhizopus microsporus var. microsporus]
MSTNSTSTDDKSAQDLVRDQKEANFTIMFVSVGFSCFIWQALTTGKMVYKSKKPIVLLVFLQSVLGAVVTFVTLLVCIVEVDCTFRLFFSVVGVNVGDMALQFVLLWKAFLGNERSKLVLFVGSIPIISIAVFIVINLTVGRSGSFLQEGVCLTNYPTYIVIIKAAIDFTSNVFLSACFILVIYRHYRLFGNSIQRTLLKEGLLYCIGYLASYLVIKQLRHSKKQISIPKQYYSPNNNISPDVDDDDDHSSAAGASILPPPDEELRHIFNSIKKSDIMEKSHIYSTSTNYTVSTVKEADISLKK